MSSKKTNGSGHNGSGNGSDEDDGNDKDVLKFPSLAERDRIRKAQEKEWKKQYRPKTANALGEKGVPFINFQNIPPLTRGLVAVFLVIHIIVHLVFDSAKMLEAFYFMGFVPGYFTGTFGSTPWFAPLGLITHIFLHGSWMHLLFNCVMGLVLGMFLEREFGARRTLIFFFACGIAGAALYFTFDPLSTVPIIGASGSISGMFGAVIMMMYQRNQLGQIGKRGPWPLVAFWVVFMILAGMISGDNVGWQAHVGGFLAGIAILRGLQKGILKF